MKLIIRLSVFLLIIAIFIECSLVPVNAFNIVLLILMTIIIAKFFYNNTYIKLFSNVRKTLYFTKYFSLVFIFLKYIFQFEIYFQN